MAFGPAAVLTFVTKLATFAITAVTAIVLARWLGPAARGEYAILTLVPAVTVALVNGGLATAITVTVGRDPASAPRALGAALAYGTTAATVGWLAAFATRPLWSAVLEEATSADVTLAVLVALPLLLYSYFIGILQGLRDFRATSTLILTSYVLVLALQLLLVVALGLGLAGAILAFVIAHAAIAVLALGVILRRARAAPVDPSAVAGYLRVGAPTYLGALTWLGLSRTPLYICALLLAPADVGHFAVAITVVEILLYAADSVVFALTPHAATAASGAHYALTPVATRAVIVAAGVGAIVLFVAADPLVVALAGSEFAPAAAALRWLLPGVVAASVARVIVADLVARDRAWLGLATLLAGAVAVTAASVLLTAEGVSGAAAAWSVGYAVAAGAAVGAYMRVTGVGLAALLVPRADDVRRALTVLHRSGLTRDARLTPD